MGDQSIVHVGENSPEQVALKLFGAIANAEGVNVPGISSAGTKADRRWILDTYAECINAVRGILAGPSKSEAEAVKGPGSIAYRPRSAD